MTRPIATDPRVTEVTISDTRTLRARVNGVPDLRTARGRDPITPVWVEATYNITTGELYTVTVHGHPHARSTRTARGAVRRGVHLNPESPEWLRNLIEDNRP